MTRKLSPRLSNLVANSAIEFSPKEVQRLRTDFLRVVRRAMPHAEAALLGKEKWSQAQVALFRLMATKIAPDVSAHHVQINDLRPGGAMSRADLEAIARGEMIDVSPAAGSPNLGRPESSDGVCPNDESELRLLHEELTRFLDAQAAQAHEGGGAGADPAGPIPAMATSPSGSNPATTSENTVHNEDTHDA